MTEAKLERLILLNEECAEIQQAISKIIRHGEEEFNPYDSDQTSNKENLEKELGHFMNALQLLITNGDVNSNKIDIHQHKKELSIHRWLHYNQIP